jgi:hypothetical protein
LRPLGSLQRFGRRFCYDCYFLHDRHHRLGRSGELPHAAALQTFQFLPEDRARPLKGVWT